MVLEGCFARNDGGGGTSLAGISSNSSTVSRHAVINIDSSEGSRFPPRPLMNCFLGAGWNPARTCVPFVKKKPAAPGLPASRPRRPHRAPHHHSHRGKIHPVDSFAVPHTFWGCVRVRRIQNMMPRVPSSISNADLV